MRWITTNKATSRPDDGHLPRNVSAPIYFSLGHRGSIGSHGDDGAQIVVVREWRSNHFGAFTDGNSWGDCNVFIVLKYKVGVFNADLMWQSCRRDSSLWAYCLRGKQFFTAERSLWYVPTHSKGINQTNHETWMVIRGEQTVFSGPNTNTNTIWFQEFCQIQIIFVYRIRILFKSLFSAPSHCVSWSDHGKQFYCSRMFCSLGLWSWFNEIKLHYI